MEVSQDRNRTCHVGVLCGARQCLSAGGCCGCHRKVRQQAVSLRSAEVLGTSAIMIWCSPGRRAANCRGRCQQCCQAHQGCCKQLPSLIHTCLHCLVRHLCMEPKRISGSDRGRIACRSIQTMPWQSPCGTPTTSAMPQRLTSSSPCSTPTPAGSVASGADLSQPSHSHALTVPLITTAKDSGRQVP